jgi:hypothetical protein
MLPKENSIGAIYRWHEEPRWEYYQINQKKAVKISPDTFYDLMLNDETIINQPLYVENS